MDQQTLSASIKPFIVANVINDQEDARNANQYMTAVNVFSAEIEKIQTNYYANQRKTKERFNIFDCLTKHHLEELHSNFLCYLLNPFETHDCGDLFLKEFYACMVEENQSVLRSEFSNYQFEKAIVEREHFCNEIDGLRTFIDIYIDCPDMIIAIENKIR